MLFASIPFIASLAIASSVSASAPTQDGIGGRLHLGVPFELARIGYVHERGTDDRTTDSLRGAFGSTAPGYTEPWPSQAVIGYGIDDRWLVDVLFSFQRAKIGGEQDAAFTGYGVSPSLSYVFAVDADVRPFVGAGVGLQLDDDDFTSTTRLSGSLRAGAHFPLGRYASVDPFVGLGYAHVAHDLEWDDVDQETRSDGIALTGGFSISAWL